jgi:hypothetical protein
MPTHIPACAKSIRRNVLAGCLAAAVGFSISSAEATPTYPPIASAPVAPTYGLPTYLRAKSLEARKSDTRRPSANPPHVVTTCEDDFSPGSLRLIIESPMTVSGDTIDLTQLPMMCSKITLAQHVPLEIWQDTLYLQGPGAASLTIDADHASSVINHTGGGTLYVSGLTLAGGYSIGAQIVRGGCVYSNASVFMLDSVVTNCVARSTSSSHYDGTFGAGLFAGVDLTLAESAITESHAFSNAGATAIGGGAFAGGSLFLQESSVSYNTAFALTPGIGEAGGVFAHAANIDSTTIARNAADVVGGMFTGNGIVTSSTISSNVANLGYGGAATIGSLTLDNSTIAFNQSRDASRVGGLFVGGPSTIRSSIIANNFGPNGASDFAGEPGFTIDGAHDLITSSSITPPPGTITDCPKLEPLLNTGGLTMTHRLQHDSPALDQGDPGAPATDQRGLPRAVGAQVDIGAVERQAGETDERIFLGVFDVACGPSAW